MIKQAYAYGASVALQEVGYAPAQAEAAAVQFTLEKTAQEDEGMSPALTALLGCGAGALLGAGGGALYGHLAKQNLINQLMGAGSRGRAAAGRGAEKIKGLFQRGEAAAAPAGGPVRHPGLAPAAAPAPKGGAPGVPFGGRGTRSGLIEPTTQPAAIEEAIAAAERGPGTMAQLREWLRMLPTRAVMPGGIASPVGAAIPGSAVGGAGLGALLGTAGGGIYGGLAE